MLDEPFGSIAASEITPQMIDSWLKDNYKKPATANRFKAYFSLAYRLGMENGKVDKNPARLVRTRKEDNARLRYLSRDEYGKLVEIIQKTAQRTFPRLL